MPSKIDTLPAICLRRFDPAVSDESQVADRRPGKRRPIMPIDRDRLLEQPQSLENSIFRYRKDGRERAQVEVVGSEVIRWPRGGSAHLGRLQCRLNHAGDADRDPVLELEDVLQRAVEAVGPQMRAGQGIDQLRSDAHALARFAHRALQYITHPQQFRGSQ